GAVVVWMIIWPAAFASAIKSGEPIFPSACAGTAASASPRLAMPTIAEMNVLLMAISLLSLLFYPLRNPALGGAAREPMRAANQDAEQNHLHQAERRGLADIAAFVIIEQQHRHHHRVAGVEKQRRAELAERQHEEQRHRGDHAGPRQGQHDARDGAEHAPAAHPGRLFKLAMNLQKRSR